MVTIQVQDKSLAKAVSDAGEQTGGAVWSVMEALKGLQSELSRTNELLKESNKKQDELKTLLQRGIPTWRKV